MRTDSTRAYDQGRVSYGFPEPRGRSLENRIVTDNDAAILDKTPGELALVHLKWQDYFTNDVRKLRSRSSNLTAELDDWAGAVSSWCQRVGVEGVQRSLRFKPRESEQVRSVHVFALSRTAARMQGFGFSTRHQDLVVANWPQFMRVRHEVGPVASVIRSLHARLRAEMTPPLPRTRNIPVEVNICGQKIRFENLWTAFETNPTT